MIPYCMKDSINVRRFFCANLQAAGGAGCLTNQKTKVPRTTDVGGIEYMGPVCM